MILLGFDYSRWLLHFGTLGFIGDPMKLGQGSGEEFSLLYKDLPWYFKHGILALATLTGGFCLFLGAMNIISSVPFPIWWSLTMGFCLTVLGFLAAGIEASFCYACVYHVQAFARKIEDVSLLLKAAMYMVAPLPTIIFCLGLYSFVGGGVVIGGGVIYGIIALVGRNGQRLRMAAKLLLAIVITALGWTLSQAEMVRQCQCQRNHGTWSPQEPHNKETIEELNRD